MASAIFEASETMNWRDQAGRLYAILDASCFSSPQILFDAADELASAGVAIIQYRNKSADARTILSQASELKNRIGPRAKFILNDRADFCLAADFDGVHLGQDDLSPESGRRIIGPNRLLGVSTHNPEQVAEADRTPTDYIAIGPVFATGSKLNPDPVIGIAGVRRARELTHKPLIAIGGITRQNCSSVIAAGADSIAVISDLVRDPRKSAEEFLRILG
jgi:thiamine-phosphate pyrophosphorylase